MKSTRKTKELFWNKDLQNHARIFPVKIGLIFRKTHQISYLEAIKIPEKGQR